MSRETGGPAFPVSYDHDTFQPSHVDEAKQLMSGMTLRDYFAAKAMQALIEGALASDSDFPHRENVSGRAYAYADAMLAARVKS